jgi:hypothetical protein
LSNVAKTEEDFKKITFDEDLLAKLMEDRVSI